MATVNDFKLVNIYCNKIYEQITRINITSPISEANKKRLGFYMLVLKLITGNNDIDELQDLVIDTDYCNLIYGIKNNDYGIDAFYIDEDTNRILLFNFKFREKFSGSNGGKQRPILDSMKFINMLNTGKFEGTDEISKKAMEKIYNKLKSDKIWEPYLFIVSNENIGASLDNKEIEAFKENYGLEIKNLILDDIIGYLSNKPKDISCKFILDDNSVLTYEENSLSSSKSYLVKLNIANLIRMTSNNEELRNLYDLQDFDTLKSSELDISVLYENVRGYLGDSKFNKNKVKTLKENPHRFFMYNNGITITSKNVKSEPKNGNKKFLFTLDGMQIVNGGQTLRSIYKFKDEFFDEEKLADASVLIRIFKTEDNDFLINEIAEFTNSQNSISAADLKSISNLQVKIENYLENRGINYIRKIGDMGIDKKLEKHISKERLAQIIYSYSGYPDRATNQKSKLFEKYYDEIFDEEKIDFEKIFDLVELYFKVETEYKNSIYKVYPQKLFYLIYLAKNNNSISENINAIEKTLKEYKKDEELSDARKLIQKGFKDELDKFINV